LRLPDAAALPAVQEGGLRDHAGVARRLPAPRVRPPRHRRPRQQEKVRHESLPLARPVLKELIMAALNIITDLMRLTRDQVQWLELRHLQRLPLAT